MVDICDEAGSSVFANQVICEVINNLDDTKSLAESLKELLKMKLLVIQILIMRDQQL